MKSKFLVLNLLVAALLSNGCGSSGVTLDASGSAGGPLSSEETIQATARAFDDRLLIAGEQEEVFNLLDNDDHNGAKVVSFSRADVTGAATASGGVGEPVVGGAGGKVLINENGALTYTPAPGDAPYLETFRYTIRNEDVESTATLTAQRTETIYVDNGAEPNGDGSSRKPFDSLQSALDALGERPGQIRITARNNSVAGLVLPLVRLRSGQAIIGQNGSSTPTPVRTRFELDSTDCVVSDLHIVGNGGEEPALRVSGNSVALSSTPKVVLRNLLIDGHDGDGISLEQATTTEITNVDLTVLNQRAGRGAVVIATPLGSVQMTQIRIENDPVGGIVVASPLAPPFPGADWSIAMVDTQMQSVRQPLTVKAEAGSLNLSLNRASFSEVQGPLFAAEISGNAQIDSRFEGVNLSGLGNQTAIMDWNYRENSSGTVRFGRNTPDPGSTPAQNSLKIASYDRAQAAFVSQGSRFYPDRNQVSIEAWDNSNLKFRLQDYVWSERGRTESAGYALSLSCHDFASIDSLILDNVFEDGARLGVDVAYFCEVNAYQNIEGLQADLDYFDFDENLESLNPYASFTFSGFQGADFGVGPRFNSIDLLSMYQLRPPQISYRAAKTGSTGIPLF